MKFLAYTHPSYNSELIHITEALYRRRTDPDNWEGHEYYDIIRLRPMFPVDRDGRSSFSYKGNAGGGHGNGSKGIAHELAQDILCKQSELTFTVFKRTFTVKIKEAVDEVRICDENNPDRSGYVDVMLYLDDDSDGRDIWGDRIAIEINDTHANTRKKDKLLRDLRIGSVEVNIIPDWHVRTGQRIYSSDLALLRARINGFWSKGVYARCIYAPSYIA